jgi:ABC-type polysaccharide/polyol phosphate export systems, permease component
MGKIHEVSDDWRKSIHMYTLWSNLALEDLRDRYRRTVLGLMWIVASFALFVLVKVLVFGQLTAASRAEFGVYVTLGFGLWAFINSMVMDACTAYMHARPWILAICDPLSGIPAASGIAELDDLRLDHAGNGGCALLENKRMEPARMERAPGARVLFPYIGLARCDPGSALRALS